MGKNEGRVLGHNPPDMSPPDTYPNYITLTLGHIPPGLERVICPGGICPGGIVQVVSVLGYIYLG